MAEAEGQKMIKTILPVLVVLIACNNGVDPSITMTKETITGHWAVRLNPIYLNSFLGYVNNGNDRYFLFRHQYFNEDGFFREEWSGKHIVLKNGVPRTERFFVFLSDTGTWNFGNDSVVIERQKCNNPIQGSNGEPVPCDCNEYGREQTDTIAVTLFNECTWVRMDQVYCGPPWPKEYRWWRMPQLAW